MTLQEIIVEIYEALGEPSDLNPYTSGSTTVIDTSSTGFIKLRSFVNQGCLELTSWKWPSGRHVRFRLTEDTAIMQIVQETYTVQSWSSPTITTTGTTGATNLQLGKLVVGGTSGATGLVMYSSTTSLVLTKISGTFVAGETITLYQREFQFVSGTDPRAIKGIPYTTANGNPITVIGLTDLSTDGALSETVKRLRFESPSSIVGTPTSFYRIPQGFVFDAWPTNSLTYLVRYQRGPRLLSAVTDVPELPEQFHNGLVLYGIWKGMKRGQETTDAYSARKDLEDFMARTRTEFDFQDDLVSGQVKLYPDGI